MNRLFVFYLNTMYTVPTNLWELWEQLFPQICRNSILFKILRPKIAIAIWQIFQLIIINETSRRKEANL